MTTPPTVFDGFRAFADESSSDRRLDPDTYILAAAVIDPEQLDHVRELALELKLPGARKAHWRDDSDKRHDVVIDAISKMPIEGVVLVRRGLSDERPERRRRKCMEPFLAAVEAYGCSHLLLESRGPADDKRDRELLDMMRAKKRSEALRMSHEPGPAEPLLWLPDALCGAVSAARTGRDRWLEMIMDRLRVTEIDERPET